MWLDELCFAVAGLDSAVPCRESIIDSTCSGAKASKDITATPLALPGRTGRETLNIYRKTLQPEISGSA